MVSVFSLTSNRYQSNIGIEFLLLKTFDNADRRLAKDVLDTVSLIMLMFIFN